MTKLPKLIIGVFVLSCCLVSQALAQVNTHGIAPENLKHYVHAKKVLEKEAPAFLTDFRTLEEEIKTIDSTDRKTQLEAFMRFLPAIEDMSNITDFDTWDQIEGRRTLQCEVIFTFFSIHLPTADTGNYTTVFRIFCDAFMLDGVHSEAIRMLTKDEIMEKHNMSPEEAQRILNVWDKLHRDWPW